MQRIQAGEFRFVVVGPEIIMQKKGHFQKLWKDKQFSKKVMSVVFDEAHCISKWGSFWPDYKELGNLRYMLPNNVHFYVTSTTLAKTVLADINGILQLRKDNTEYFL
jgi:superfamily II DNA helicase RecQ